jgi:crotonobetainyl-CoA:carnitine CoA-transferase CaiB-like acyl-CoA transferase
MDFGQCVDVPIAPVYDASSLRVDPHVAYRTQWLPIDEHGADLVRTPIKLLDGDLPTPSKAPTVGQHTDAVLHDVLGYDAAKVASLRATGAVA